MALINCPECGKEMSDKAVSCPTCGYSLQTEIKVEVHQKNLYREKHTNSKKVIFFIIGFLLLITIGFGATAGRKMIIYNLAISCMEKGEVDEAKEKFSEIADYKDSSEYIDKMTSKINGVSDRAYYLGIKFVERVSAPSYREELGKHIAELVTERWGDEWEKVQLKDIVELIKSDEMYDEIQQEIHGVVSGGSNDAEFAEMLDMYYYIIVDNAYAMGLLENGKQCSDKFAIMCSVLQFSDEIDVEDSTLQKLTNLDDLIELAEEGFKETTTLSDLSYLEIISMMTILYIAED